MSLKKYNQYTLLSGVAMNAAEGDRTIEFNLDQDVDLGRLQANFTHSAATEVILTIYGSIDGVNYGGIPQPAATAADVNMDSQPTTFTWSVTGDATLISPSLDFAAMSKCKIIVSSRGGGASDTFSLVFNGKQ